MSRRHRATTVAVLIPSLSGLLGLVAAPATAAAPDSPVFVNEIHYDNAGTDTGEAVEVAGPAGTDLRGWQVVLYNGSNGGAYRTLDLAATLGDQQGGLGTTWVTYETNGIQNGSPDGVALVNPAGEAVQLLSYEGTFTAESGPAEGLTSTDIGVSETGSAPVGTSLQLTGSGTTYADFVWAPTAPDTFGTVNHDQTFGDGTPGPDPEPRPQPDACDIPVSHEIGEVQGPGDTTPVDGVPVTVEGVVVGDFQGSGQFGGFFLQDPDGDGDRRTSDGVFVYAPGVEDVSVGDVVRVTGRAGEYPSGGEEPSSTQISAWNLVGTCGTAAVPDPTTLTLPATVEERERLEHMLVTVPQETVATESYTLGRYGELWVSLGERLYQPTNDPGNDVENRLQQEHNDLSRLLIDDGSSRQNPWVVPFTDDQGPIRLGDTVAPVTGVLDYAHDAYRIQPTAPTSFTRTNLRTAAPDEVGGDLRVASFNVLNYFTTIDRPGVVTDAGQDPRGADTDAELARQQAKIVSAITQLDADVVGLMEIENDADDEAVDNLVAALNTAAGEERYAAVDEPDTTEDPGQPDGLFGTDAIKVAMIYQPGSVSPVGPARTVEDPAFYNARLPLAQTFEPVAGGDPFTVVVNHLKSKGCYDDASGGNLDTGDGQGCYNADRMAQAQVLADFVDSLGVADAAIIGDLNSYGEEDPIHVLEDAGFVDTIDRRVAAKDQYTYVYSGQAGYLDHALVSRSMFRRVTGVDLWHINSDEATALDYNDYNQDDLYSPDPYKSSDHDPVLLGLRSSTGGR